METHPGVSEKGVIIIYISQPVRTVPSARKAVSRHPRRCDDLTWPGSEAPVASCDLFPVSEVSELRRARARLPTRTLFFLSSLSSFFFFSTLV